VEREQLLTSTFVELADNLVVEFDVIDVLTTLATRSVALLAVDAAGIMLGNGGIPLHLVAASGEQASLLELFELQAADGPALECFRTGLPQTAIVPAGGRWPAFGEAAAKAGYQSVDVMPMRLRSNVIGALALLSTSTTDLGPDDLAVAQALADVATISVLQHRALQDAHVLADQLTQALSSRVVIEQAKGVLCERLHTTMDDAFNRLRRHARATNQVLSEVARKVTTSEIDPDELTERPGA
jgi:GAF domain-containing protein